LHQVKHNTTTQSLTTVVQEGREKVFVLANA
jgi:hypothetical protein